MPLNARVLLAALAAALAVQAAYAAATRRGLRRAVAAPAPAPSDRPISVVVAARDEAARLAGLVAALGAQTHAAFEVVVVDDGSSDATADLVAAWAARDARVRLVRNGRAPGKKGALETGIAAARHPALALTDADCAPPPGWLRALAGYHDAGGDAGAGTLVVLYAPYRRAPGALNRIARYETFVTGALTAAALGLGRPYMAVGRGLSYTRATFEAAGGFARHAHLLSGDDDLFVQDVAARTNARIAHAFGPATHAVSDAPASWRAWLRQKRRHLSDGRHYPPNVQRHLAAFHATSVLLWLAPLAGAPGTALLAAHLGLRVWALAPASRAFGERDLLAGVPLYEAAYLLYNALLAPASMARTLRRW